MPLDDTSRNRSRLATHCAVALSTLAVACGARSPLEIGGNTSSDAAAIVDAAVVHDDANASALCAPGAPPVVLASAPGDALFRFLVSADDFLYYADANRETISRLPKRGGDPATVVDHAASVFSLAVDASSVYWSGSDEPGHSALLTAPRDGGAPRTLLVTAPASSGFLVINEASIYFTVSSLSQDIVAMPKTGGSPVTIGPGLHVGGLDATNVFAVVKEHSAIAYPKAGGGNGRVVTTLIDDFVVSDGVLYAIRNYSRTPPLADKTIMRIGVDGTGRALLSEHRRGAQSIRVAGDAVYWLESGALSAPNSPNPGDLLKAPKAGGGDARILASEAWIGDLVVDDACVYYVALDATGRRLMKVAR